MHAELLNIDIVMLDRDASVLRERGHQNRIHWRVTLIRKSTSWNNARQERAPEVPFSHGVGVIWWGPVCHGGVE